MMKQNSWINVDLAGLAATLSRNGKNFILSELLRNSWDEFGVTKVDVVTSKVAGRPLVRMLISDNSPDGFKDLSDAYTMFADSKKKTNPEMAGRFNCGEKFSLALCESATIESTTGTIHFQSDGARSKSRKCSAIGTTIDLFIRMTSAEHDELCAFAQTLLAPRGIETTFNGDYLAPRKPVANLRAKLTTEIANGEGILRKLKRETIVEVLEPREGELPTLYELGIPVMPLDCKWHVNIQQKVPLTMERDSVPPSYLRDISSLIVNELHASLNAEEATANWVTEGVGSKDATPEAVTKVMDLRFGEKRVAFDPSDLEANKIAVSEGYQVVHGGSLPKEVWRNVKATEAIKPAGQVTPSPKPFSKDGKALELIPREKWNMQMFALATYATVLGFNLISKHVIVRYAHDIDWGSVACYGNDILIINLAKFSAGSSRQAINELLLHEFAHAKVSDHLSREFYDEIASLGAQLVELALSRPELFK
jgi:hypothetical protein